MTAKELNEQAQQHYQHSRYQEAEAAAVEALRLAGEENNKEQEGYALNALGITARNLSDYPRAIEYYAKSLAVFDAIGNKSSAIRVINNTGHLYLQLADYSHALEYFSKALILSTDIGDQHGTARALGNIGLMYEKLSDFPRALEYYRKALAAQEELDDKRGKAIIIGNIGTVYNRLSDYARALEYYSTSLAVLEELGDKSKVATLAGNIGSLYADIEDYPHALEYMSKALVLHIEIGDKFSAAMITGNIGMVYDLHSDYTNALNYFTKALTAYEELGLKNGMATIMANFGNVYKELSDYSLALQYYTKAVAMHEELGNTFEVAVAISNIGSIHTMQDFDSYNPALAEQYLFQARATFENLGTKLQLYQSYSALAHFYEQQRKWKKHSFHYKKYHELEKEVQSEEAKKQAALFNHKLKIQEFEHKLQIEKQQLEAENALMRQNLEHKSKELENTITQVVEKNTFLNTLTHDIQQLRGLKLAIQEEMLDAIQEKIRKHLSSGAVTAMIYDEIESVHGDFIKRMKEKYPSLTETEVRVSALLRMKLNSANIASLLFISQRTVELHRLRVRKKMKLKKEDNLYLALSEH